VEAMFYRGRVKPSKGASLFGMIIGILFVVLGVTMVLPSFGIFGIIWTLIAVGMTIMHGYNFFTHQGFSEWEVDVEPRSSGLSMQIQNDFEAKLRKIERLKAEGILSEEEYQLKRSEILKEKW
jgi:hypothetical protein